jgi:DNA modification methylase
MGRRLCLLGDSTKRNDIVLDSYIGSGTTILAAERTDRRCFVIEIDPIYVDTTITRWEQLTGQRALNTQGNTFAQVNPRCESARRLHAVTKAA